MKGIVKTIKMSTILDEMIEEFTKDNSILYTFTCFTIVTISTDLIITILTNILSNIFGVEVVESEISYIHDYFLTTNIKLLCNLQFLILANNTWIINLSLLVLIGCCFFVKNSCAKLIIFYDIACLASKILIVLVNLSVLSNLIYRKINIQSQFASLNNLVNLIILCLIFALFAIIKYQLLGRENYITTDSRCHVK